MLISICRKSKNRELVLTYLFRDIQYLLRGRFLRGGPGDDLHRIPSSASREIGQLQQRHAVSGLRYFSQYMRYFVRSCEE